MFRPQPGELPSPLQYEPRHRAPGRFEEFATQAPQKIEEVVSQAPRIIVGIIRTVTTTLEIPRQRADSQGAPGGSAVREPKFPHVDDHFDGLDDYRILNARKLKVASEEAV